ncbi:MAG: hypothetical protein ACREL7_09765 [Longimicrobiales bacterium]
MYDWNTLALLGVVGFGMTTSVGLLVHTLVGALRDRNRRTGPDATCPCC